ncbi:putative T6SS immunity periplasmic lipoprotein [Serratia sp. MYb239]
MGMMMKTKILNRATLLFASVLLLSGCPGTGDRLTSDETATASKVGEDVCFQVPDSKDYQPSLISINPRNTPPQRLSVTDSPDLTVKNGMLCIPPEFYQFPLTGQFIVQYILASPTESTSSRSVVAGIELSGGQVRNIPLTDAEITR